MNCPGAPMLGSNNGGPVLGSHGPWGGGPMLGSNGGGPILGSHCPCGGPCCHPLLKSGGPCHILAPGGPIPGGTMFCPGGPMFGPPGPIIGPILAAWPTLILMFGPGLILLFGWNEGLPGGLICIL